ncbi:MAG: hypothetical protein D8M57_17915 [Candidatus Scalindua sp. AMX11]|nr:MAG: hypothetical protein DWQ00_00345 [Candidatus Scalindua sp.]TDE63510.1 MAG: hypothetical protein D8M57_17915 [Candidatus Scalindua sp. AMX11]
MKRASFPEKRDGVKSKRTHFSMQLLRTVGPGQKEPRSSLAQFYLGFYLSARPNDLMAGWAAHRQNRNLLSDEYCWYVRVQEKITCCLSRSVLCQIRSI